MGHMEEVSFTYEKITWTFDPDGIEAKGSWLAQKS
jgi:type VI secretion system secreted protein Hcp